MSERVFTLLHLFGHSVQCCAPSEAAIVIAFFETPRASDEKFRALANYEFRAAQFSLQLLHELGVGDLDRWFADFVHIDHKMVAQSYRTGALPPIRDCLVTNQELIRPAAIPADLKPGPLDRTSVAF